MAKNFSRADHFRQYLKQFYALIVQNWTSTLEDSCSRQESLQKTGLEVIDRVVARITIFRNKNMFR